MGSKPRPEPAATPAREPAASAAVTVDPPSADPAENAYLAGYRLWEAKRYDEAEAALKDFGKRYPKHPRASWARTPSRSRT